MVRINQALNSKADESRAANTPQKMKFWNTLENLEETLSTMKVPKKPLDDKYVDIIPTFPSPEVDLKIEEIHPLDIFYSTQHKSIVKRERKKRNINQSQALVLGNTSFEVLWKGSTTTPIEELGRLTQFTGSYALVTIEKEI